MQPDATRNALTRLLVVQYRSLATYLCDASPWTPWGEEHTVDTLQHIASDQRTLCARIADFLVEHHGRVDTGEYPLEFTGLNDCGMDYMLRELIAAQKQTIAVIERCVAELTRNPAALALAEESLGAARGHLESLEELQPKSAKAASHG